jgi:hypothetical protein
MYRPQEIRLYTGFNSNIFSGFPKPDEKILDNVFRCILGKYDFIGIHTQSLVVFVKKVIKKIVPPFLKIAEKDLIFLFYLCFF